MGFFFVIAQRDNIAVRHSREGGNPAAFVRKTLDPDLRGDDGFNTAIYEFSMTKRKLTPHIPCGFPAIFAWKTAWNMR
jgi:hypothetical protein